jgi:hypothetical protein
MSVKVGSYLSRPWANQERISYLSAMRHDLRKLGYACWENILASP